MISEIYHLIHFLSLRGSSIDFCWIPSHCGLAANERVDRLAKNSAAKKKSFTKINIPLSLYENYSLLGKVSWDSVIRRQKECPNIIKDNKGKFFKNLVKYKTGHNLHQERILKSLIFRIRLDAYKTKYCKNVTCICGQNITPFHVIFLCRNTKKYLPIWLLSLNPSIANFWDIFGNEAKAIEAVKAIVKSPVGHLL